MHDFNFLSFVYVKSRKLERKPTDQNTAVYPHGFLKHTTVHLRVLPQTHVF